MCNIVHSSSERAKYSWAMQMCKTVVQSSPDLGQLLPASLLHRDRLQSSESPLWASIPGALPDWAEGGKESTEVSLQKRQRKQDLEVG